MFTYHQAILIYATVVRITRFTSDDFFYIKSNISHNFHPVAIDWGAAITNASCLSDPVSEVSLQSDSIPLDDVT